jgi:hypothetical protein
MRTCTAWFSGLALALTASACSDPSGPSTGPDGSKTPGGPQSARTLRGIDREFVEIARAVPGFGGVSRASDGSAIMYLTDPSQAAAAKQAVAARSRVLRGIDVGRIQVRAARFDYIRLADWRERIREGLDVPGLVFLDIDEATNNVHIGVAKGTSHELIVSELAKLEVPSDAFNIEDTEPVRFTAALTDRIRPTRGGIQIGFTSPSIPVGFFGVCTLGFNARRAGSSETYVVMNSHCSGEAGGVQHTPIYQPTPIPNNLIATEVLDPDYFTEGCFPHRRCRFSDAALARYEPGVEAIIGAIARTTLRGLTAGSTTIADNQPTFTITDVQSVPVVGQTLDKMGRTTGWTVGTVAATCIDFTVTDTDVALLCQNAMYTGNGGGDSGSPIFESQAPFTSDVTLYGILWGGGSTSFGPFAAFSPFAHIELELGQLIVTAP